MFSTPPIYIKMYENLFNFSCVKKLVQVVFFFFYACGARSSTFSTKGKLSFIPYQAKCKYLLRLLHIPNSTILTIRGGLNKKRRGKKKKKKKKRKSTHHSFCLSICNEKDCVFIPISKFSRLLIFTSLSSMAVVVSTRVLYRVELDFVEATVVRIIFSPLLSFFSLCKVTRLKKERYNHITK